MMIFSRMEEFVTFPSPEFGQVPPQRPLSCPVGLDDPVFPVQDHGGMADGLKDILPFPAGPLQFFISL
jgi:hypothetical protein